METSDDPEIMDDIVWMLEKLLLMSKHFKKKIRLVEAEKKADIPAIRVAQKLQFDALSTKIYNRYVII